MRVSNEEAYSDNTKFTREIELLENGYFDRFVVESENEKTKGLVLPPRERNRIKEWRFKIRRC